MQAICSLAHSHCTDAVIVKVPHLTDLTALLLHRNNFVSRFSHWRECTLVVYLTAHFLVPAPCSCAGWWSQNMARLQLVWKRLYFGLSVKVWTMALQPSCLWLQPHCQLQSRVRTCWYGSSASSKRRCSKDKFPNSQIKPKDKRLFNTDLQRNMSKTKHFAVVSGFRRCIISRWRMISLKSQCW